MKRHFFENLKPVCPRCRRAANPDAALTLASVFRETNGVIEEGVLLCPRRDCLSEYPVIDGIPIIVPNARAFVAQQAMSICARADLGAAMESLIGDCCGPGSALDTRRQHLSAYVFDHYGDLDPEQAPAPQTASPGGIRHLLAQGLSLTGQSVTGPVIDVGCAAGRSSFDLAAHTGQMVLGVDLNFDLLRAAARVLNSGAVSYPLRRVGMVYDRREFAVSGLRADLVDFWACDALALPFASATFGLAASFNVLDCVAAPREHLLSLAALLRPGAEAMITSPYDWSLGATPVEAWVGGHSQRSASAGASDAQLRALLTDRDHPAAIPGLELAAESNAIPWSVRLHERGVMRYEIHMIIARAIKQAV